MAGDGEPGARPDGTASGRSDAGADLPSVCVVTHPLGSASENATRTLLDVLGALTAVSVVTAELDDDSPIRDRYPVVELTEKGAGTNVAVAASINSFTEVIPQGCTVILESTVYPGATEEVVAGRLTENGLIVGKNVFIAFSPERIDLGNEEYGPTEIPKVFGSVTDACGDRGEDPLQSCIRRTRPR